MKRLPLYTKILIGLALGVVVGLVFGEKAAVIRPIGTVFIRLITMIVVPLVFVSLTLGTASLGDIKKVGRIGVKTFAYFTVTTIIAISLGLGLGNLLKPGTALDDSVKTELQESYAASAEAGLSRLEERPSTVEILIDIVPTNPIKALTEGNMLQVIFMALLFGIALTLIPKAKSEQVTALLDSVNDAVIQIVHIAMKIAPYGVLALIASVVGQFGLKVLVALLNYSLVTIAGLAIHAFVVNGLAVRFLGRMNPLTFFRAAKDAMLIAFSTSSSSAALPVGMQSAEKIGVKRQYSSFVIPLGTTINMDGTALYQGVSAIFIAQIYGLNLSLGDQLTIVLMATLASIGTAGVPAAGIIMLVMVLKQIGIPLEGISLIMGVERLLDMCRTATNMAGNIASSVVIQASEKNTS
ncbi:MAG: dicarboxylate/amino acid:cation symporter [Acidobacteriota bacterium]|nr:dicarboxylate/amino acid:cation symporter [Acidobacteriota bacterium]